MHTSLAVALPLCALFALSGGSSSGGSSSGGPDIEPEDSDWSPLQWLYSLLPQALAPPRPHFCKWLECPSFNVTERTRFYETRYYDHLNWVVCPIAVSNASVHNRHQWERERRHCYWSLFSYISGNNSESKKLKMAVPVVERFSKGSQPFMAFFLPGPANASALPAPVGGTLKIVIENSVSYYVRSFRGFGYNRLTRFDNWRVQTEVLERALRWHNKTAGATRTAASYDAPWQIVFRHNEVWIDVAAPAAVAASSKRPAAAAHGKRAPKRS